MTMPARAAAALLVLSCTAIAGGAAAQEDFRPPCPGGVQGLSGFMLRADQKTSVDGAAVTFDPRQTFVDSAGGTMTLSSATIPEHGSISVENNRITYRPSATFRGRDRFMYTMTNSRGGCIGSLARIEVQRSGPEPRTQGGEIVPSAFSASSAFMPYTGLTNPNGMRDGVYNEMDTFHGTRPGSNEWIQADLGRARPVASVEVVCVPVRAPGNWGCQYTNGAIVEVSLDGTQWRPVATVSGAVEGQVLTLDFDPTPARYIRLRQANNYMALGDFRVFGPRRR